MSYWYTDELGRKRHVQNETSDENKTSKVKKHTYKYHSAFYTYADNIVTSYLSPTKCPVCKATVYFCNCSNGGRVFFDTLAPLWEKHPCTTTHTSTIEYDEVYSFIIPSRISIIEQNGIQTKITRFSVPDFMNPFELDTSYAVLHKNITESSMILVKKVKKTLYLTVIVTSRKYNNKYLIRDKSFQNQIELEQYLIKTLSQVDLRVNISSAHKRTSTDKNKKIIKINKLQSKQKKQVFKPIVQEKYISKKTGLKIKKKKNETLTKDITEEMGIEDLEKNGWKIVK